MKKEKLRVLYQDITGEYTVSLGDMEVIVSEEFLKRELRNSKSKYDITFINDCDYLKVTKDDFEEYFDYMILEVAKDDTLEEEEILDEALRCMTIEGYLDWSY